MIPTLGSKEAIFSFAQVVLDARRRSGHRRRHRARLPGSRAVVQRSRGRASSSSRCARSTASSRPSTRCPMDAVGTHGTRLAQHAEQPDGRRRAARAARPARVARARARLRPRLGRGVLRALVRRAAAVRAPAHGLDERRGVQHALEAVVDDRLPQRVRRRRPGAGRRPAPLSAEHRHGAAGVRPAGVRRRLGRRGARRASTGELRTQAGDPARRPRPQGPPRRGRSGDDVSLDRGAGERDVRSVMRRGSSNAACS